MRRVLKLQSCERVGREESACGYVSSYRNPASDAFFYFPQIFCGTGAACSTKKKIYFNFPGIWQAKSELGGRVGSIARAEQLIRLTCHSSICLFFCQKPLWLKRPEFLFVLPATVLHAKRLSLAVGKKDNISLF